MSQRANEAFERLAHGKPPSLLREFASFLRQSKKWWLLPIIGILLVLGIVLYLGTTIAAPFTYTLF